jgi:hypothetical protein
MMMTMKMMMATTTTQIRRRVAKTSKPAPPASHALEHQHAFALQSINLALPCAPVGPLASAAIYIRSDAASCGYGGLPYMSWILLLLLLLWKPFNQPDDYCY